MFMKRFGTGFIVLVLAVMAIAWFDGGEQSLHPIAQVVEQPINVERSAL